MELGQYILQGRAALNSSIVIARSLKHLVAAGTLWPFLKLSVPYFLLYKRTHFYIIFIAAYTHTYSALAVAGVAIIRVRYVISREMRKANHKQFLS